MHAVGSAGKMFILTLLFLLLVLCCCGTEGECACNDTTWRLGNRSDVNCSALNISESAWDNSSSSSTWMPLSSGRVEVCWGGEWRGLLHGSIRTTRQLELICQELGFSPEGAPEICDGVSDDNYTDLVHCWFDVVGKDNLTIHNCSNATSLQQQTCNMASDFINLDTAAVIKCKTLSQFSPQDIALMVLCPLSFLLISALVIVTLRLIQIVKTRARNQPKMAPFPHSLKKRAQNQLKETNRVQVTTRKCVAYEACTLDRQDEGIHQESIRLFRSNLEASVAAKTNTSPCEEFGSMHQMEPNYDEVRDIFEIAEFTLKARARSLEHLPLKQHKKTMRAGKSRKPPLLPKPGSLMRSLSAEWDGDFRECRKESAPVLKSRMGVSLPRNIRKPPPLSQQYATTVPFAECSTVVVGSGSKSHGSPGSSSRRLEPSAPSSSSCRATVVGVVMERSGEECKDFGESGGYVRVDP